MKPYPKAESIGECTFLLHCRVYNLTPEREFKFALPRKYRFDFAWPERKLAVEVEGGTWINGRHNRASSIEKDMSKYNLASRMGWVILRFSTAMVVNGAAIAEVLEVLGGTNG